MENDGTCFNDVLLCHPYVGSEPWLTDPRDMLWWFFCTKIQELHSTLEWGVWECLHGYVIASLSTVGCTFLLQGERSNRTENGIKGHHPAYQDVCVCFSLRPGIPSCTWGYHDTTMLMCFIAFHLYNSFFNSGLTRPSALPGLKFGPNWGLA